VGVSRSIGKNNSTAKNTGWQVVQIRAYLSAFPEPSSEKPATKKYDAPGGITASPNLGSFRMDAAYRDTAAT
jgi:hypothetical protein